MILVRRIISESTPILLANSPILRPTRFDVLLDTSGLLCCLDAAEIRHQEAVTFFEAESLKITHNYVLVEFVALAHARRYPRHTALTFVADIAPHPISRWSGLTRNAMLLLWQCCRPSSTSRIHSATRSVSFR